MLFHRKKLGKTGGDFSEWHWRDLLPFLPILEQAASALEYEGFAGCGIIANRRVFALDTVKKPPILQLPLLHQYFPIPAPKEQTSLPPDILF